MSRGVVIGGSGHIGAISRRGWFPPQIRNRFRQSRTRVAVSAA